MVLNKQLFTLLLAVVSLSTCTAQSLEIPVFSLVKINFNEVDPSSDPEVMMRQFEYTSSASAEVLLKLYRSSEHIKSCEYNDLADNYMCQLVKLGKVFSGHVFIPSNSNHGEVVIFADYFYIQ